MKKIEARMSGTEWEMPLANGVRIVKLESEPKEDIRATITIPPSKSPEEIEELLRTLQSFGFPRSRKPVRGQ